MQKNKQAQHKPRRNFAQIHKPVSLAVDSSGIKVHNGRDWIIKVWKVKKGYLKIHFAINTKKQIVSM
jgi:hypothetical protein